MFPEEFPQFVLEQKPPMMLRLLLYVRLHARHQGMAHGKNGIARLPMEISVRRKFFMYPF